MRLNYEFDNCDYEYRVDFTDLRKALVTILCRKVKAIQGKLYDEVGAYQMAMYVVYDLDLTEELAEQYEDELNDYFYQKAYEQFVDEGYEEEEKEDWFGTIKNVRGL